MFTWPGLGKLTVEAVSQRDYPVLQGAFLLLAVAVVIANLFADLVLRLARPAGDQRMSVLVEATAPQTAAIAPQRRTFSKRIRRPMGALGLIMLTVAVLVAIFAPLLAPYDPYANVRVSIFDIYQPPSPAHPLGTDDGGKDVLSSLIYGARVSLVVGFAAAAITAVIGGADRDRGRLPGGSRRQRC